jgi:hypothetical protein
VERTAKELNGKDGSADDDTEAAYLEMRSRESKIKTESFQSP